MSLPFQLNIANQGENKPIELSPSSPISVSPDEPVAGAGEVVGDNPQQEINIEQGEEQGVMVSDSESEEEGEESEEEGEEEAEEEEADVEPGVVVSDSESEEEGEESEEEEEEEGEESEEEEEADVEPGVVVSDSESEEEGEESEEEEEEEGEGEEEREEGEEEDDQPIEPEYFITRERREFPEFVKIQYSKYLAPVRTQDGFDKDACKKRKRSTDFNPFRQQKLVRDFLAKPTPYRGALIYHGLGSGKTCTSVAVAEGLKSEKEVIVMLPASLRGNFYKQLMVCGDRYFRTGYKWRFNQSSQIDVDKLIEQTGFARRTVDALLQENGGFFDIDNESGQNVRDMDEQTRNKLNKQISELISEKYSFLHYNGLTEKRVKEIQQNKDFFANKTIIIDEVHNFISMYVNESKIIRPIYNMILRAKNTKVVALTGTPIINKPNELAAIVNLINGYNKVYTVNLKQGADLQRVLELARSAKYIHYYYLKPRERILYLVPLQDGFENVFNEEGEFLGVRKNNTNLRLQDKTMIDEVLTPILGVVSKVSTKPNLEKPLPDTFNDFVDYFVDGNNGTVANPNLFMRRILGLVSHYEGSVDEFVPQFTQLKVEKLDFTDYMLQGYSKVREQEIEKEKKSSKKRGRASKTKNRDQAKALFEVKSNTFKVFSRQACNTALPEGIERPYPAIKKDEDLEAEDYKEALGRSINQLYEQKDNYVANLSRYSPKYVRMLEHISKSQGNVLVYSQFISLEGLGAFGAALEGSGYYKMELIRTEGGGIRLRIPDGVDRETFMNAPKYAEYTGREDKDLREVILNIYNNDLKNLPTQLREEIGDRNNLRGDICKVLMISSSGAEGLDLKNIRQIHLMEPYWNNVRVKQVIGRGIRVCSHMDLPIEERHVELFLYVMRYTRDQIRQYQKITLNDKNKSTDEIIYDIAIKKERIVNQFIDLMKRASFDCALNATENSQRAHCCYTHPRKEGGEKDIMIRPFLADEQKDDDVEVMMANLDNKIVRRTLGNGRNIIIIDCTNDIYDGDVYERNKTLKVIGRLEFKNKRVMARIFEEYL
jgi:superfamily II DNA or RNA helicase